MFWLLRPATLRIGAAYSRSSCSISASRIIGMPALEPFCARAGTPASVTAAAVTSATAREAGLAGRALLGGLARFIWDSGGPSARTQTMDGAGHRQRQAGGFAAAKPRVTRTAECGSTGGGGGGATSGIQRRIHAR